jgi:hypothetical protein
LRALTVESVNFSKIEKLRALTFKSVNFLALKALTIKSITFLTLTQQLTVNLKFNYLIN